MEGLRSKADNLLILFFLLTAELSKAQPAEWVIQGQVLDAATHQPIGYANIGIIGKKVGTLSNTDGSFSVRLSQEYAADVLTFAALGFETQSLTVADLRQQTSGKIYLKEKIYSLAEVVVRSKTGKLQEITLGINRRTGGTYCGNSQTAGAAMAVQLRAETVPFQISKARLRILYNPFPDCKVRVRLLSVDPATGKPDKDLLDKSVIVTASIERGWVEVDLSQYKIKLEEASFYLAFEWIEDDARRKATVEFWEAYQRDHPDKMQQVVRVVDGQTIESTVSKEFVKNSTLFATSSHPSVLAAYPCYRREASLAEWKRSSEVLVATATVVH
jgi:hypothetical protein